ncbi:MAG: isoprenylcysteine carboxylmethyltransferase family protein [Anaerolineaceae bacterium]|nr:isoprenylcysteine carboxylmethyltransferase family protein [Anaerolineaceae bacterium]
MPNLAFKIIYVAALVVEMAIRAPLNKQRKQIKVTSNRVNRQEAILLGLLFLGNFLLPLLYIFSPWLNFANYTLPPWAGWLGAAFVLGALIVFWRAHVDLGRNWSPTLQILDGHKLITQGIYGMIRHPMYASQWLWVLAQPLLIQNWIAGLAGALFYLPMYFIRVPVEERMMLEQFGDEYRDYMRRVGRVLPRLR